MIGLIVLQPYADQLINREKKIEYRKQKCPKKYMDTPMYLLSKGKALGIIKFINVNWFSDADGVIYGHVVEVIKKFDPAKDYDHPNGAQVWVKEVKITDAKE